MERIGASKLTGKEERNHSFWKFSGENTEKFNGSKCYGEFFQIGEICVIQRLRKKDAI